MWFFTDIADWFDEQKRQANRALDDAVESSDYNHNVILAAVAGHTIMELGGSVVDLARLGDGIASGTLKGLGQDALRVVAIFPVGKAAQMMKTAKGTTAAKVVADIMPRAGICAWVASAKGLRHIGHSFNGKILATVDDLVKAVGVHPHNVGGLYMPQVTSMLRQIGAKVGPIRNVKRMRDVERMVPFDGSVVLFSVKGKDIKSGKPFAHLVYAYREMGGLGPVKIMDRSINKAVHRPYSSLAELTEPYSTLSFDLSEAVVLHNVFLRSIQHDIPRLLIPVPAVIATYKE
jgi:hypothetical protein